jgi:purine-binding chemotaxis protein CheW
MTPVPGTPDFVSGVTNLRGQVLAVMELREFFGITQQNAGETSQVLVLGIHRPECGILADAVDEVLELHSGSLLDVPPTIAPESRQFFRGVTKDALVVLAGDVLLQDARLFVDDDGKSLVGTSEESS